MRELEMPFHRHLKSLRYTQIQLGDVVELIKNDGYIATKTRIAKNFYLETLEPLELEYTRIANGLHTLMANSDTNLLSIDLNDRYNTYYDNYGQYKQLKETVYSENKQALPVFVPACRLRTGGRTTDNISTLTGIVGIDVDGCTKEVVMHNIDSIKNTILLAYNTTRGNGCRLLFRIEDTEIRTASKYSKFYKHLYYYFKEFNVEIDPQCTEAVRAMYIAHDAEVYVNYDCEPLDVEHIKTFDVYKNSDIDNIIYKILNTKDRHTNFENIFKTEFEKLYRPRQNSTRVQDVSQTVLNAFQTSNINPASDLGTIEFLTLQIEDKKIDITTLYSDWSNRLGFALAAYGEEGRAYFHRISCFNASYDVNKTNTVFTDLKNRYRKERMPYPLASLIKLFAEHQIYAHQSLDTIDIIRSHFSDCKFRYNIMKNRYEFIEKNNEMTPITDEFEVCLLNKVRKIKIPYYSNSRFKYKTLENISRTYFCECVFSTEVVERYNPLNEFFVENYKKFPDIEGFEEFDKLCKYFNVSEYSKQHINVYLKEFFLSMIQSIFTNKTKDWILVLIGPSGTGKSRFFSQELLPELSEFIGTDFDWGKNGKEDKIQLARNILIWDDEGSMYSKSDAKHIKKMTSTPKVISNIRQAFYKHHKDLKRIALFGMATNDPAPLAFDEAGHRRELVLEVETINNDAIKNSVNINKMWAEIYNLYLQHEHEGWFRLVEDRQVLLNNERYVRHTEDFERIVENCDYNCHNDDEWLTINELKDTFGHTFRVGNNTIGSYLRILSVQQKNFRVKGVFGKRWNIRRRPTSLMPKELKNISRNNFN